MKKMMMLVFSLLLMIGIATSPALAAGGSPAPAPEEERDCLPEEGFSRYFFATPDNLMPDVETTQADAVWNYQCAHDDNRVDVQDSTGAIVKTIQTSGGFGKGENRVSWDGLDNNGKPVPDGIYTVVITPNDEFAAYAMRINVTIKLFKYPAIYGIFGDELKDRVKALP